MKMFLQEPITVTTCHCQMSLSNVTVKKLQFTSKKQVARSKNQHPQPEPITVTTCHVSAVKNCSLLSQPITIRLLYRLHSALFCSTPAPTTPHLIKIPFFQMSATNAEPVPAPAEPVPAEPIPAPAEPIPASPTPEQIAEAEAGTKALLAAVAKLEGKSYRDL